MGQHPITAEVEEFVKWTTISLLLHEIAFIRVTKKWHLNNKVYTTPELFDWWRENVYKK